MRIPQHILEVSTSCPQPTDHKDTEQHRRCRPDPLQQIHWSLLLFSILGSLNKLFSLDHTVCPAHPHFPSTRSSVGGLFTRKRKEKPDTHETNSQTTDAYVPCACCSGKWELRCVSRSSRQRLPQPKLTASWTPLASGSLSQRCRLPLHHGTSANRDQRHAARSKPVSTWDGPQRPNRQLLMTFRCRHQTDIRETTSSDLLSGACLRVNTPVLI